MDNKNQSETQGLEKDNNIKDNNIFEFKIDEKILESIAEEALEKNDAEKALSIYLEIERTGKYGNLLLQKIADLYTELGMYTESINYWFKYLSVTSKRNYAECYNGLGGNFFLAGYKNIAVYYFNLQINDKGDDDFPFDDYMYELFYENNPDAQSNDDLKAKTQNIRLYDEKNEADEEKLNLSKKIFEKDKDKAIELLSSIDINSDCYSEAQIALAPFYLIDKKYDQALHCFEESLNDKKYTDLVLNDILAVSLLLGDENKCNKAFSELQKRNSADYSRLVKYFILFYKLGEHNVNYEFSKKVLKLLMPMPNLYVYCGIAALNVGKASKAYDMFSAYYDVTHSYFADYYRTLAKNYKGNEKFEFRFLLPDSALCELSQKAEKLLSVSARSLKKYSKSVFEIQEASFSTTSMELQAIACQLLSLLNTSAAEKTLKKLLLSVDVNESIKLIILTMLVELGNDKPTPMVFGSIYMIVPYEKVEFNEERGDVFRDAYAVVFGRLAPYVENDLYKLKNAAYDIYYKFLSNGNIKKVNDPLPLAGLILSNTDLINSKKLPGGVMAYLGTSKSEVLKLQQLLEQE